MTTTKPSYDRVPFRRGVAEENALRELKQLGEQHSQFLPALSSDNLWLRFSVRLLAELCELAADQALAFQVGEPGRGPSTLRVLGAPPTELSAGTAEARLRPGETALLQQLGSSLKHPSRSATLRHALFACQQVCERAIYGDLPWLERAGMVRTLPRLVDIAATMEQAEDGPVRLLCTELVPVRAAAAVTAEPALATESETVVFCNVDPSDTELSPAAAHVEFLNTSLLLRRARASELSVDVDVDAQQRELLKQEGAKLRVILRPDQKPVAEVVVPLAATRRVAPVAETSGLSSGTDGLRLIRGGGARGSSFSRRQSTLS